MITMQKDNAEGQFAKLTQEIEVVKQEHAGCCSRVAPCTATSALKKTMSRAIAPPFKSPLAAFLLYCKGVRLRGSVVCGGARFLIFANLRQIKRSFLGFARVLYFRGCRTTLIAVHRGTIY